VSRVAASTVYPLSVEAVALIEADLERRIRPDFRRHALPGLTPDHYQPLYSLALEMVTLDATDFGDDDLIEADADLAMREASRRVAEALAVLLGRGRGFDSARQRPPAG